MCLTRSDIRSIVSIHFVQYRTGCTLNCRSRETMKSMQLRRQIKIRKREEWFDFQVKFDEHSERMQDRIRTAHVHALYRRCSNKSVRIDLQCQCPMRRFKRPRCETVFYSVARRNCPVAASAVSAPLNALIYTPCVQLSSLFSISHKCLWLTDRADTLVKVTRYERREYA